MTTEASLRYLKKRQQLARALFREMSFTMALERVIRGLEWAPRFRGKRQITRQIQTQLSLQRARNARVGRRCRRDLALEILSNEYFDEQLLQMMITYLESGRAQTLSQALALLEEEIDPQELDDRKTCSFLDWLQASTKGF